MYLTLALRRVVGPSAASANDKHRGEADPHNAVALSTTVPFMTALYP